MLDMSQTEVIAAVVLDEARGENVNGDKLVGMVAVSEVIRMRVAQSGWKLTPYDVVTRRHQFSGVARDGCARLVARMRATNRWSDGLKIAEICVERCRRKDGRHGVARGSTHFYSGSTVPKWARGVAPRVVIGGHKFFRI